MTLPAAMARVNHASTCSKAMRIANAGRQCGDAGDVIAKQVVTVGLK